MTGTGAATFPMSSSVCIIFLMRAWSRKENVVLMHVNQSTLIRFTQIPSYRRKSRIVLLFCRHFFVFFVFFVVQQEIFVLCPWSHLYSSAVDFGS